MQHSGNNAVKKKICFVATFEMAIKAFLLEHIKAMSGIYDLTVIVKTDDANLLKRMGIDVPVIPVSIERQILLGRDLKALIRLYLIFREHKFDVVHSIMHKSGLLAMTAAFFARIPVRIHCFTGQIWVTRSGVMKYILRGADKLTASFATNVLVDSKSQKEFLAKQGIVSARNASVLANGSVTGVNTERFRENVRARAEIRTKFDIPQNHLVFLFLGRLTKDKGVIDLAGAFAEVSGRYGDVHLLVVGPDEQNMGREMKNICSLYLNRLHFVDYTDEPESYMAAADVLCLPSYREGFGSVIIEAAATGIPAIGARIYGITDAIEDGVTGLLHEAGNVEELASQMVRLIEKPVLTKKMGKAAQQRAAREFSREIVTAAMLDYYEAFFREKRTKL